MSKATITFDDVGGITIEGDEEAVRRAYEIWDPYRTGKYRAALQHNERPAEIDVEVLKRETSPSPMDSQSYNHGWNDCIDHLAATGRIAKIGETK